LLEAVDLDTTYGVVLGASGWHPGVIGIVASRLVEEINRPVVLVALEGDQGKGSGRSIGAFDLHAGLSECRDLLLRFGGHRSAAGVTVAAERLSDFARRFNEVARERLSADDLLPEIRVDLELPLREVSFDLESLLRHFEPFGAGNATPVIAARGVRLAFPARVVGQGHLKLRLTQDGADLDAMGWGMGALAAELDVAVPYDVAFRLERDDYNGDRRLVAKLADIRR
jgi:single-stranded-DNA-specific exonuclease